MKKSIMQKWVKALRSGEYKQTRNKLRSNQNGFCCLGVLCNLHAQEHPKFAKTQTLKKEYDGSGEFLSERVMKWSDIQTEEAMIDSLGESLSYLNDSGYNFKKIADIIEKNYKEL